MSDDKSGSPPCGIYVRIDDFSDMPKVITNFRQMAMTINRASGYENNMSVVELSCDGGAQTIERITDLIPLIQSQGFVVIISGEVNKEMIVLGDGVLLSEPLQAEIYRSEQGDDKIIGLLCTHKDEAEKAMLVSADYVILPADPMILNWWSSKTQILSVARGDDITNHACGALVRTGVSFIDVSQYIFSYEKGVMQATVNILHAIDTALQSDKKLH